MLEHDRQGRFSAWTLWAAAGMFAIAAYMFAQGRVLRSGALAAVALLVTLFFRMSRRKYALFVSTAIIVGTALPVVLIASLDLYLHHRYASNGGFNTRGYRGPIVGRKQPGERRIAVLGGSTAFGYGVRTDETFPWHLEQMLNQPAMRPGEGPVTVVNLAWNGEGAHSFRFTLEDYDYLDPDVVILYSGYNDFSFNNLVFRRESAIFRLTGYLPILPVIPIREWLQVDDLSQTRKAGGVAFEPNLADRSASGAADLALRITQALEKQLIRLSEEQKAKPKQSSGVCDTWTYYCDSIHNAIAYALARDRQVIVVTEPYVGGGGEAAGLHVGQQNTLVEMLTARFPAERRVHYLNMGDAVDLTDPTLCYDGLHLTAEGNAQLASRLAPALASIVAESSATVPTAVAPTWTVSPLEIQGHPKSVEPVTAAEAQAAAARGLMRSARALTARAAAEARTAGRADVAAVILARQAVAELIVGNNREARALAASALATERNAGSVWAAALVHALGGEPEEGAARAHEFEGLAPADDFTRKLWMPILRAAIDLGSRRPAAALSRLDTTVVWERGTYWPSFLRGAAHLASGRGVHAEHEYLRILARPGLGPTDLMHVVSRRHLARARVLMGVAAQYGETYQAFFSRWLEADADVPLLVEAKTEYLELRKSIGMPPLPF